MVESCPHCLNNVFFNNDICPSCKKSRREIPNAQEVEKKQLEMRRQEEIRQKHLENQENKGSNENEKVKLASGFALILVGIVFSFVLETGYIWSGAIVVGITMIIRSLFFLKTK